MIRTLESDGGGTSPTSPIRASTQAHIARIARSPIITRPARTIAMGIILGLLAVIGLAIVFAVIWMLGISARRYFHWD